MTLTNYTKIHKNWSKTAPVWSGRLCGHTNTTRNIQGSSDLLKDPTNKVGLFVCLRVSNLIYRTAIVNIVLFNILIINFKYDIFSIPILTYICMLVYDKQIWFYHTCMYTIILQNVYNFNRILFSKCRRQFYVLLQ